MVLLERIFPAPSEVKREERLDPRHYTTVLPLRRIAAFTRSSGILRLQPYCEGEIDMKRTLDRLNQAEKTAALVNACSVSIEQAVRVALMGIGGTVIDAKLKEKDEQVLWRIQPLTAGGPVKMYIDGCSGRILKTKHEKPLTAPDGMVIPEVVVADRLQNPELVPLSVSQYKR